MKRNQKRIGPRVSGCLQVGPGRLEVLSVSTCDDGVQRMHYRIVGDVLPYFSAQPVPGSTYTYQDGIGTRTEAELRHDFAWALTQSNLMGFRGLLADYPYREQP